MLSNGWEPGSKAEARVVSYEKGKEALVVPFDYLQGLIQHFGNRCQGRLRNEAGNRTGVTRREISSKLAPRIQRGTAEP